MPSVGFEVRSADRRLPALLMGVGHVAPRRAPRPGVYAFSLEFGSDAVAAAAANWMWSQLQGHAARLRVGGEDVPVHHGAIKAAFLAAVGRAAG
jgi:hypothetical protein